MVAKMKVGKAKMLVGKMKEMKVVKMYGGQNVGKSMGFCSDAQNQT